MKAFVLAAGEATRLSPYSDIIPKPMMHVGDRPVLRRIIERLKVYGFIDIVLCVNTKHEGIFRDYFEDGSRFGINIEYSVSPHPQGTAGELLIALRNGLMDNDEDFLLHYGDELTKIELDRLLDFHERHGHPIATLALVKNVPLEIGVVKLENDKVVDFVEKPPIKEPAWSGVAILKIDVVSRYCHYFEDLGRDVFPRLAGSGEAIYGYVSEAEYLDMGTISHYRRACTLAKEGKL